MSDLIQFDFSAHSVRVILRDGNPWFVAADVCASIGIKTEQTRRLDDDEKDLHLTQTPSGQQEMTIINESGLYSLILGSRKPEAKKFKKWVTSEVLPAIRKTGSYAMPATSTQPDHPLYSTETITADQYRELREMIRFIGGLFHMKNSAEYAAWRVIKKPYGLSNAKNLPVSEFESVSHHLSELKRMSDQFRLIVTEAEAQFFRKNFGADSLPSEFSLSGIDCDSMGKLSIH